MTSVSYPLANGGQALVDQADLTILEGRRWVRVKCGKKYYAASDNPNGKPSRLYMHRVLLGIQENSTPWVDHIDGDGLNNTRVNLRTASASLNAYNRKSQSKFRGVFPQGGFYVARVGKNYGGSFDNEIKAALAADSLATTVFGTHAILNFPPELGTSFLNKRFLEAA
ncbi:hypothetical protein ACI2VP_05085 [Ralstonia nicotianae]